MRNESAENTVADNEPILEAPKITLEAPEKISLDQVAKAEIQKLSTIQVKRPVGRPRNTSGSTPQAPQAGLGRTQAGSTGTSGASSQIQPPRDYRFTIKKAFGMVEKLLHKRFKQYESQIEEIKKLKSEEKELEGIANDCNESLDILTQEFNLGYSRKLMAIVGFIFAVSIYVYDKYLLILEIRAKIDSIVSKKSNTENPK